MSSLYGRDQEVAALRQFLATAGTGVAVAAVLDGERGSGKTALLEAFRAEHPDLPALQARAVEWERDTPGAIIEQLLRSPCATEPWPALLRRLAATYQTGSATGEPLATTCAATTVAASAGASATPLLVLIDDAHWADLSSLRVLTSALDRADTGVLALLAVDPECAAPGTTAVLELLERHRRHGLALHPLNPPEVAALAESAAGIRLSAPAARLLAEHTGGNPGRITRLLRETDPEIWSRWMPLLPVPRAEQAAVSATLAAITPEGRRLVEAAAVLGDSTELGRAAALADLTDPVAALDAARTCGLLLTDLDRPLFTVTFPAPLVRGAVLASLTPLARQALHRRAADQADDEGRRLDHLVAAQPVADADLATRLDDYAATRAANGEWAACAAALIQASHMSPSPALRENRLVRGVDALVGAGSIPQAEALAPEIASFDDSPLRDCALGYLAIMRGRPSESRLLLTRAWHGCGPDPTGPVAANIGQRHVIDALARWDGQRLLQWSERVARITVPSTPEAVEAAAIIGLGHAITGALDAAARTYADVLADTVTGAQSQRYRMAKGWLSLAMDGLDDARLLLESAVPTTFRFGSTRISLWAQGWLARVQFTLGEWNDALHTVDRAAAIVEESGIDLLRPLIHWTGAQIHVLRGEDEAARHHLRLGRVQSQEYLTMHLPSALAHAQYAQAHADHEGVLRALSTAARVAPGSDLAGFWPWADLYANALVTAGRIDDADRFLARYEDQARASGHRSSAARFGAVRGRITAATKGINEAAPVFAEALHALDDLAMPYDRARIALLYGQTLRRAGKRREADTVMRSARETFAALGASVLVERCDRELKAAGVNAKRRRDPFSELTEQERTVARLVMSGKTNKQAAEELFLSVKTIQYHLTRVYAKLRVRSRTELVAYMRELE
ncbi:LuxR C-terminal-related transcriptional regulator [Nocardia sp. NPDC101769]|uniref:helix-turn-helix transcriptional regulator n=1 Tax=Nocardia sp. NPDC101769 TaxID=3364333 RepID=UPI0037FD2296